MSNHLLLTLQLLQTEADLVTSTACYQRNRRFSLKTYQTNPNSSELTSRLQQLVGVLFK